MTIVELPENTQDRTFIRLWDDGKYMASIWGIVTSVDLSADNQWHITIMKDGTIIGFYHADAIRRK